MKQGKRDGKGQLLTQKYVQTTTDLPKLHLEFSVGSSEFIVEQVILESCAWNLSDASIGMEFLLDKYFAGSAYTAAWYMGLVDNASFSAYAAGDTLASHTGWLEYLDYTISGSSTNRATAAWNAASAGSKASTATTFTISGAGGTVLGALMCTTQARNTSSNGGAGILYSAGTFTGGSRAVTAGDTLLVTYTASV